MKTSSWLASGGLAVVGLVLVGCTSASPKTAAAPPPAVAPPAPVPAPPPPPPPPPGPTHTVSRSGLKPKAQFDAVFESAEMRPLRLSPKAWMDWTVVEVAAPGTRVRRGEVVVECDSEKLREQLADLEEDRPGGIVALELAQAELENLRVTTPLRLEAARRAQRTATEDLSHFEMTGKEQREKSARFNLKSSENYLANQMEELKQLEQMYKADDLTEETEEIVLKRQRFEVERAQFSLENARISSARELETLLPREAENQRNAKRDQDIAAALADQTLPRALAKKQLDTEKMQRERRKADKRIEDLKADLEAMQVRAPIDGVVYYGACVNGRWATAGAVLPKLAPGGKLTPNEVFMTVVNPERIRIKAVVPEAEVAKVSEGMRGSAAPTAQAEQSLPVRVEEVGAFPLPTGGFEAVLSFESVGGVRVVPGMTCKVQLGDGQRAKALTVPNDAVATDGTDKVVWVVKDGATPARRVVRTGASDDAFTEVVEGLSEGEKILLKKP